MEGVSKNAGVKNRPPPPQDEAALSWRPHEPVVNGGVNEATGWVFFQCNMYWAGRDEPTGGRRQASTFGSEVRLHLQADLEGQLNLTAHNDV